APPWSPRVADDEHASRPVVADREDRVAADEPVAPGRNRNDAGALHAAGEKTPVDGEREDERKAAGETGAQVRDRPPDTVVLDRRVACRDAVTRGRRTAAEPPHVVRPHRLGARAELRNRAVAVAQRHRLVLGDAVRDEAFVEIDEQARWFGG